ncbi:MAG TPA: hypothetical protein VGD10_10310 [Allosphingosinicella sp.]|uniref:hypothetical protein n=1 Tax=Allosphingosinicella sp. TaxID=2823234 RepID=UPI002ED9E423
MKSATDVMQEIVFAAVIDAVAALKTASKGLPNTLLRDINAIHANATFRDLPPELQAAISESVRAAFTRLLKEGYAIGPKQAAPQRTASAPHGPTGHDRRSRRPPPKGDRPRPGGPPRGGGPGRGPKPGGKGK